MTGGAGRKASPPGTQRPGTDPLLLQEEKIFAPSRPQVPTSDDGSGGSTSGNSAWTPDVVGAASCGLPCGAAPQADGGACSSPAGLPVPKPLLQVQRRSSCSETPPGAAELALCPCVFVTAPLGSPRETTEMLALWKDLPAPSP